MTITSTLYNKARINTRSIRAFVMGSNVFCVLLDLLKSKQYCVSIIYKLA